MKESRKIIMVVSFLFIIIGPSFYYLSIIYPNLFDYFNVATNIYCGLIVALITSVCQFCSSKRKIINNIYSYYFDVYRAYYNTKNKPFLWHYSSYTVYKKMMELNPKIIEALDDYQGFFRKHDKTYKKLNPIIKIEEGYKVHNVIKSLLLWFNKRSYYNFLDPFINNVEIILKDINKKRFEQDKYEMIRMNNIMWSKNEK